MKTVAEHCWEIAAECEHAAEMSRDNATRLAFRQIAKALASLAFSEEFAPMDSAMDSEDFEAALSENTPSFEMPFAEEDEEGFESNEREDLASDEVDAEDEVEKPARTRRLSLPSRIPFPKR